MEPRRADAAPLLDALDTPERERLLALWRAARERQHAEVTAAVEQILRVVPLVFRGTVRRMLG